MSTRPFAYNPSGNILGTQQFGSLTVGIPVDGFESQSVKFWNGPDENLGYIIAQPDSQGLHIGADGDIAYLGFIRSSAKTEASFLEIVNLSFNQSFLTGDTAKAWLNSGGYWTSYGEDAQDTSGTNFGVTMTIQESGSNVVWSYSGSLDLSNLSLGGTQTMAPGFSAASAEWAAGPNMPTTVQLYTGASFVTFPASFGGAGGAPASSGTGDALGVIGGGLGKTLLVPEEYVSNAPILGSTTYLNQTLSSLGLTEGTYTYSWGSDTNESITVLIGGTSNGTSGTSGNSGSGLGEWSFYSDEGAINTNPPMLNGNLIITAQSQVGGTIETYDPNYDPNDASVFSKYVALNLSNSAGVSRETEFTELMNNGGTISLTQNGQTATYSFNSGGPFFVDPNGWFVIPISIQTTSTSGPFVYGDPISITLS